MFFYLTLNKSVCSSHIETLNAFFCLEGFIHSDIGADMEKGFYCQSIYILFLQSHILPFGTYAEHLWDSLLQCACTNDNKYKSLRCQALLLNFYFILCKYMYVYLILYTLWYHYGGTSLFVVK